MKIKDHFLSQEFFEVKASDHQGILKTSPQPKPEIIGKYYDSPDYISHHTKTNTLKDHVYQRLKSFMILKKKKIIFRYKQEGTLLDIGAGTGEFLESFSSKYWKKLAIEPSQKARVNYKDKKINLIDSVKGLENKSIDVITLWHSLEHILDLEQTLSELYRLIKPDGIIIIAVPNYRSYDAQFYKSAWAAWDVPRHLWHFSRQGLISLCNKHQLKCTKEIGMPLDAYYVSLLSENYKTKGFKPRALWVGGISNLKARSNNEFSSIMYILRPFH